MRCIGYGVYSWDFALMHPESDRTQKLFNSLLRAPAKVSKGASVRSVHQLRTTIRRVETLLGVQPANPKLQAKVLKQLAKLRRRAGKVRDLDVQVAALRSVKLESAAKDRERVMRALNKAHARQTKKLADILENALRHGLRKHLRRTRTEAIQTNQSSTATTRKFQGEALVRSALDEFAALVQARRTPLNEDTLHEFRLANKALRYKAEIAGDVDHSAAVVTEFKRIQDAIGEWHDWLTLTQTAQKVLARSPNSPLIAALRGVTRSKYLQALRTTAETQEVLLALREDPSRRKAPRSTSRNGAARSSVRSAVRASGAGR
jgi:CHAD domain-containing protein